MTRRLRAIIGLMLALLLWAVMFIIIDERASRIVSGLRPTNEEMLETKGR